MKLIRFLQTRFGFPRRKAFDLIKNSEVLVDGSPCLDSGFLLVSGNKVDVMGEEMFFDDKIVAQNTRIVIPFYKPKGVLCSHSDPHYEKTFLDILPDNIREIYPLYIVGRLDKESHGLVLLTNDGDFVQEMTHPSKDIEKEYEVVLDGKFSDEELEKFRNGMILEGEEEIGKTKPVRVYFLKDNTSGENYYKFILTEGRNRQIRRMCKIFGKRVLDLKRLRIGEYRL